MLLHTFKVKGTKRERPYRSGMCRRREPAKYKQLIALIYGEVNGDIEAAHVVLYRTFYSVIRFLSTHYTSEARRISDFSKRKSCWSSFDWTLRCENVIQPSLATRISKSTRKKPGCRRKSPWEMYDVKDLVCDRRSRKGADPVT